MNPKQPETYPRRILLMVTGRSPQVVTETIYALCVTQDPPFMPTEIRIITTSEGAQDARLSLLSEDPGWFQRLRSDWHLPEMRFGPDEITVLKDGNGQPLADIRTKADNDQTANFIVDTVRDLTGDDACALHVSLAGGRKTMGYFLGYALSLYGRAQDRLSHVLVSSPFESNRDFYYPTPTSRIIYSSHAASAQQRPLDAKDGEVMLADIPFVRLRDHLASSLKSLQTGKLKFSDVVATTQAALEQPALTVDYRDGHHGLRIVDGSVVKLPPTDLAFYGWLARRRMNGLPAVFIPNKAHNKWTEEQKTTFTKYLIEYQQEANLVGVPDSAGIDLKITKAMTNRFFTDRKTSIKTHLESALSQLAKRYEIRTLVTGTPKQFGLDIPSKRITFETD